MLKTAVVFTLILRLVFPCSFGDPKLHHWAAQRLSRFGDNPCAALSGGNATSGEDASLRVKAFLFQKDEDEVLSDWLQYYSHMFGAANLVVIDHESQSQRVCRLLELYKLCGAEIMTYSGSFDKKHAVLTREMKKHNDTFLLPLDADEFVISPGHGEDSTVSKAALRNAFSNLPIDGRKYKFSYSYFARPTSASCWAEANSTGSTALDSHPLHRRILRSQLATDKEAFFARSKTFYHSTGFLSTDQGNHYGKVNHDRGVYNENPLIAANLSHYFAPLSASIVHYSLSSFRSVKQQYLRGFAAYNFTLDSNCSTAPGGRSYCNRGKTFLTDQKGSKDFYLYACLSDKPGVSLRGVSDWFQGHTLSLAELVG